MAVTVFSPAKINLYLAVTGKRSDGFHDLVSVVAPLDFGDELTAELSERVSGETFRLECDHLDVPLDASNLILKAAQAFAEATGWPGKTDFRGVDFKLTKRIPIGAGLGGGSSNAVAALKALNELAGCLLSGTELTKIAINLGSDCALFLHGKPLIIRGRGELIEALPEAAARKMSAQRVLLFKPSFGISTPWAYGRMAGEAPRHYLPGAEAERILADWLTGAAPLSHLLFNNMEGVAFEKFIALPVLLGKLRQDFGVDGRMSGSGSCCFALIASQGAEVVTQLKQRVCDCWGESVFVQEASLI